MDRDEAYDEIMGELADSYPLPSSGAPKEATVRGRQVCEDGPMDVIVNGRLMTLPWTRLSYEDIVELAFPRMKRGVVCTVTWCVLKGNKRSGSLIKGQEVALEPGMVLEAAVTDGA